MDNSAISPIKSLDLDKHSVDFQFLGQFLLGTVLSISFLLARKTTMKAPALALFVESSLSLIGFLLLITASSSVLKPQERAVNTSSAPAIQSTLVSSMANSVANLWER